MNIKHTVRRLDCAKWQLIGSKILFINRCSHMFSIRAVPCVKNKQKTTLMSLFMSALMESLNCYSQQKECPVAMVLFHLLVCLCLSSEERESWIRAKYEQKLFVAPLPPPTPGEGPDITVSGRLLLAVMEHNLPKLLLLLAHCTKEDINAPLSLSVSSRALLALRLPGSALHAACQQGDVVMTQLLLWVGFTLQ